MSENKKGPIYTKDIRLMRTANDYIYLPVKRYKMSWDNSLSQFAEPKQNGGKKVRILNLNQINETIEIMMSVTDETAYALNASEVSDIENATDPREVLLRKFFQYAESGELLQLEVGGDTYSPQKDANGSSVDVYQGYVSQVNLDVDRVGHAVDAQFKFGVGIDMNQG